MATFLDWGSSGWKGLNAPASSVPGWELPGFDDSGWADVTLPIGNGGSGMAGQCPIHTQHPPAHHWPINSEFLLRRTFARAKGFRLDYVVDNNVAIWWNGDLVRSLHSGFTGDCPDRFDRPAIEGSDPASIGTIAIRCIDVGVESYGDFRIVVEDGGFLIGQIPVA